MNDYAYSIDSLASAIRFKRRSYRAIPGAVISDRPAGLIRKKGHPETVAEQVIEELQYYGGFLVCESCPQEFARRIAVALNFLEGISTDQIELLGSLNKLLGPAEDPSKCKVEDMVS